MAIAIATSVPKPIDFPGSSRSPLKFVPAYLKKKDKEKKKSPSKRDICKIELDIINILWYSQNNDSISYHNASDSWKNNNKDLKESNGNGGFVNVILEIWICWTSITL